MFYSANQTSYDTTPAYRTNRANGAYGNQNIYYGNQNAYQPNTMYGANGGYGNQNIYCGNQNAYQPNGAYGNQNIYYGNQNAYGANGGYGNQNAYGVNSGYGNQNAYYGNQANYYGNGAWNDPNGMGAVEEVPGYVMSPGGLLVPVKVVNSADYILRRYEQHLLSEGKCDSTIKKYLHALRSFFAWIGDKAWSAVLVREWIKLQLESKKAQTVNGYLAALNGFFQWQMRYDCVSGFEKVMESPYREESRSLSQAEFLRLLRFANAPMQAMLQAFRGTGIRVSELQFFTVEAVQNGRIPVRNKGKSRDVFLNPGTRSLLLTYCKEYNITSGVIFCSEDGKPLSRKTIWQRLKQLAAEAGILSSKVFPHNLRHLFAIERYKEEPDLELLRLDLGHRLISTTQRYLKRTMEEHYAEVQRRRM